MISGCSVLIVVVGIFTNILSLSYFVSKIRSVHLTRNTEGHTLLFLVLNIFDLLVSVSLSVLMWLKLMGADYCVQESFALFCKISVLMTGFLTCLLAVLRAIHLIFPGHVINLRAIKLSIAVFGVIILILQSFYLNQLLSSGESFFQEYIEILSARPHSASVKLFTIIFHIEFCILLSLFIIVVLANMINIGRLNLSHSPRTTNWKRKATVTVAIISVIYCVCNVGFVALVGTVTYSAYSLASYQSIPYELINIINHILLPLNSACNPVVYFIRNADMRSYVRTLWEKFIASFLCRNEKENTATVSYTSKAESSLFVERNKKKIENEADLCTSEMENIILKRAASVFLLVDEH